MAKKNNVANKAEQAEAFYLLGIMFDKGETGVEQNKEKAFEYFKKAADLGHAESCYLAAEHLKKTARTKQQKQKVINYYQVARDQGHRLAIISLPYFLISCSKFYQTREDYDSETGEFGDEREYLAILNKTRKMIRNGDDCFLIISKIDLESS